MVGTRIRVAAVVAFIIVGGIARSAAIVTYSAGAGTGGEFRYNLTLDNTLGTEDLAGFLVVKGGSVFGLDSSSLVGQPSSIGGNPAANWDSIAPVPGFVDPLSFFSLDPSADVQPGKKLAGFFFQSLTDPAFIRPGDFEIIAISSSTSTQIPLGDAVSVPEPDTILLMLPAALLGFAQCWATRFGGWGRADLSGKAARQYAITAIGAMCSRKS